MKPTTFFALGGTCILILAFFHAPAQSSQADYPNYVVIGAFAVYDNAVRFVDEARASVYNPKFDFNLDRQLYYVFSMTTSDRAEAIREARRVRATTRFDDAWVYQGPLGRSVPIVDNKSATTVAAMEQPIQGGSNADAGPSLQVEEQTHDGNLGESSLANNEGGTQDEPSGNSSTGIEVIFHVFRGVDGSSVEAEISLIDVGRSAKVATYTSNEIVHVDPPSRRNTSYIFTCERFGYRKLQRNFNFEDPTATEFTTDEAGNIIIPFELIRLRRGDIAVMYNVFFYRDAGVMRPESRYEINSLLEMMKENPAYRIRLHGHTNGNAHGKIITRAEEGDFFSIAGTREGFGSVKKLAQERANTIMEYLIANGIEPGRVEIKSWGGKRPIHDKNSSRAQENVRVEVEILED